jgi:hypothetical protein
VPLEIDEPLPPPVAGCHDAVVPLDVKTYVLAPIGNLVALFVPLPRIKSPVVVIGDKALNAAPAVVCPVPPFAIGNVPVTPVESGSPVAFVKVPDVGVPNIGVTNVGDVANTKDPEPVSSVTADAKLALDGVARNVATPVPKPLTPVEIGKPVALVNVALCGVPNIGVTKVGEVAKTKDPDPVSSVTAAARLALDGVAKNVATPVPKPETPVLIGNPVVFVKTPLEGVPSAGVVKVGEVRVTPENVVTVAPKATLVDPIVTVELVNAELPMLVNVFVDPLIDLFVRVSVVALPTKVSVLVGSVNVPVFVMVDITGLVNVLLVSVCVPVRVVTTLVSIAIVTALAPVYEPPVNPVEMVKALGLAAVTVPLAPKAIDVPLMVVELLTNMVLVTVPVSPVVTNVPLTVGTAMV